MKDLTELEAFEIVARLVNKLFDEAGDELEASFVKLNDIESTDDLYDSEMLSQENFTNAFVMTCNIHEGFWNAMKHMYPDTFEVLNKKAKSGELK